MIILKHISEKAKKGDRATDEADLLIRCMGKTSLKLIKNSI